MRHSYKVVACLVVFVIAAILSRGNVALAAAIAAAGWLAMLGKDAYDTGYTRHKCEGAGCRREHLVSAPPARANVDRLLDGGGEIPTDSPAGGSFCPKKKEGFLDSPLPGPRPPYPVSVAADDDDGDEYPGAIGEEARPGDVDGVEVRSSGNYPGAIGENDGEDEDGGPAFDGDPSQGDRPDSAADGLWTRNHPDRDAGEYTPAGNPFALSRVDAPKAAPPGVDDEATADNLDGDEAMTYQARSRNDATRVTAGTMNRRADMDQYLREEVEERENTPWWGQHEL